MTKQQYRRIEVLKDCIMGCNSKKSAESYLYELKFIADSSPEPEGSKIVSLWDALGRYATRGANKESLKLLILSDMMVLRGMVEEERA